MTPTGQLGFWPVDVPASVQREAKETRNPVRAEISRLAKSKAAVLARLQRGPATNYQLVRIAGLRAVGRIPELRKAGWLIESKQVSRGTWKYILRGRKTVENVGNT